MTSSPHNDVFCAMHKSNLARLVINLLEGTTVVKYTDDMEMLWFTVQMRRRSMSRDAVEKMEILLIEDNLENANVTIQYPA